MGGPLRSQASARMGARPPRARDRFEKKPRERRRRPHRLERPHCASSDGPPSTGALVRAQVHGPASTLPYRGHGTDAHRIGPGPPVPGPFPVADPAGGRAPLSSRMRPDLAGPATAARARSGRRLKPPTSGVVAVAQANGLTEREAVPGQRAMRKWRAARYRSNQPRDPHTRSIDGACGASGDQPFSTCGVRETNAFTIGRRNSRCIELPQRECVSRSGAC